MELGILFVCNSIHIIRGCSSYGSLRLNIRVQTLEALTGATCRKHGRPSRRHQTGPGSMKGHLRVPPFKIQYIHLTSLESVSPTSSPCEVLDTRLSAHHTIATSAHEVLCPNPSCSSKTHLSYNTLLPDLLPQTLKRVSTEPFLAWNGPVAKLHEKRAAALQCAK